MPNIAARTSASIGRRKFAAFDNCWSPVKKITRLHRGWEVKIIILSLLLKSWYLSKTIKNELLKVDKFDNILNLSKSSWRSSNFNLGARTIDSRPQVYSQRHTARFSGANGKIRARYNQYVSQEGKMPEYCILAFINSQFQLPLIQDNRVKITIQSHLQGKPIINRMSVFS